MSAWTSVIGSAVNGLSSLWSIPWTNTLERKNATDAYERNLSSWMMQNDYNSPSEQMKRLKDAGLNPNLIYGSVNNSAGAVSSAPVARAPNVPNFDLMTAYQNLEQQDAMTQQIKAQRQVALAQKSYIEQQMKALKLENAENAANGTSRGTPLVLKELKQFKNSVANVVSELIYPEPSSRGSGLRVKDKSLPAFGSNLYEEPSKNWRPKFFPDW